MKDLRDDFLQAFSNMPKVFIRTPSENASVCVYTNRLRKHTVIHSWPLHSPFDGEAAHPMLPMKPYSCF